MDTRDKIISGEAAVEVAYRLRREGRKLAVVTGCFDVLLAAHARDLENVRSRAESGVVMAVLLPIAGELLAQRARAELVAGLGMIDYVVTASEDSVEDLLRRLPADLVVSRRWADEQQKRLLIEHVQSRHSL
jgi:bifunctional ADP-heptose synthase (sugar kinase/adenylyltransferase)